jgi:hypothetical protein
MIDDLTAFPISIPPGLPPEIEQNWHLVRLLAEKLDDQIDTNTKRPKWEIADDDLAAQVEENKRNLELLLLKINDFLAAQTYFHLEGDRLVPTGYMGLIYNEYWKPRGNRLVPTGKEGASRHWELTGGRLAPTGA